MIEHQSTVNKNMAPRFLMYIGREYEKELGSREKAIQKAIKYSMKHDILKEFLELHAGLDLETINNLQAGL